VAERAVVDPPVLRLEGLTKRYRPDRPAVLEGLGLTLRSGEYLAIMGESGVGKSTLLNLLAGLDRADAGSVALEGVNLSGLDDDAATLLRRRAVGFVFQAFHVLPYLTVRQNVALPLELLAVPEPERRRRTLEMLEAVGIGGLAERFPRELSGGEVQRIAIARALVHRPRLVLADEPTGNLDPRSAAQILTLLRDQIKANAGAGILITHSRTAAETADRILRLDAGGLHDIGGGAAERDGGTGQGAGGTGQGGGAAERDSGAPSARVRGTPAA
jgi:putative ABC transport system ATP-binding protein